MKSAKMEENERTSAVSKEYYKLFWITFLRLWKSNIDWKAYSVEIISAGIGGWLFVRSNGWDIVMTNIWNFCLYVVAIPVTLALMYSVYQLVMTPVEVYKSQQDKVRHYKEEAELFTTKGIEVICFESAENDVRPVGILVTNMKSANISCHTQITRYWAEKTEVKTINFPRSLSWYEDAGRVKNFGYTKISSKTSELIILEHIQPEIAPGLTVKVELQGRDIRPRVYIELGEQPYLGCYAGETCFAEVDFMLTIEGHHFRPPPLQFEIGYDGEKMIVKKVNSWW